MVRDVALGMWYVVRGIGYVVCGTWYWVRGMWYWVRGMWYVVHGIWYLVCDMWYVIRGTWYGDVHSPNIKLTIAHFEDFSTQSAVVFCTNSVAFFYFRKGNRLGSIMKDAAHIWLITTRNGRVRDHIQGDVTSTITSHFLQDSVKMSCTVCGM